MAKGIDIPDTLLNSIPNGTRYTLGAPRGLEDKCQPLEVIVEEDSILGGRQYTSLIQLSEHDMKTGYILLHIHGSGFPPIAFSEVDVDVSSL